MHDEPSHLSQEETYQRIQFLSPSMEEQLQLSPTEADLKHHQSQNSSGQATVFSNLSWSKNLTVLSTLSREGNSTMQEPQLPLSEFSHLLNPGIEVKQLQLPLTPICQLSPNMKNLPSELESEGIVISEQHPKLLRMSLGPSKIGLPPKICVLYPHPQIPCGLHMEKTTIYNFV